MIASIYIQEIRKYAAFFSFSIVSKNITFNIGVTDNDKKVNLPLVSIESNTCKKNSTKQFTVHYNDSSVTSQYF